MRAHLDAIRSRWPGAQPLHLWMAPTGQTGEWLAVEAPAWGDDPDPTLDEPTPTSFRVDVRVRAVGRTPDAVAAMLRLARHTLPGVLTVPGRVASLAWVRSEWIGADDTIDPTTGQHPAVGVDTYQLTSQET